MKINTLKDSDNVKAVYLVSNVTQGKTKGGDDYLNLVLQDNSGDIDAKKWQATAEEIKSLKSGDFILVNANVINYRNSLQMKIEEFEIVAPDQVNLDDFIKQAPIDIEELKNELVKYIKKIDNENINKIVSLIVKKYGKEISVYPAASRIHHAYKGGLLHHIISMLHLGDALIGLYPGLNKDYLYAGIILHDLGKIEELNGVIATEYTLKGRLVGHISIIHSQIHEVVTELGLNDSEEAIILEHLVIAHHGKLEYGSPVLPLTREAEVLNFIDMFDAKMNTLNRELDNTEEGNFTDKLFFLDNRSFYKPKN